MNTELRVKTSDFFLANIIQLNLHNELGKNNSDYVN